MICQIHATCVDEALYQGLELIDLHGIEQDSRNGKVRTLPAPVMTTNEYPERRVLFNPKRNANPFFHLMEALWMLAGRDDIEWLDQFVADFSKRFGDPNPHGGVALVMHGAYGKRWRDHFDLDGGGDPFRLPDQLRTVIGLLKKNHRDRQAVISMWDPAADLARNFKDVPCNTHIYLRVRAEERVDELCDPGHGSWLVPTEVLDLTVSCRSNDVVLGAHGANAVHFSVLQEYLAAQIGVQIGNLYQLSNNYHFYTDVFDLKEYLAAAAATVNRYERADVVPTKIVTQADQFDSDLQLFFSDHWRAKPYSNRFFWQVACPMRASYECWRNGQRERAVEILDNITVAKSDWVVASQEWYARALARRKPEA